MDEVLTSLAEYDGMSVKKWKNTSQKNLKVFTFRKFQFQQFFEAFSRFMAAFLLEKNKNFINASKGKISRKIVEIN
jgi:hypothetical protein